MNFNVYLDEQSAERLDRLARKTQVARNALIRKAVHALLEHEAMAWPREVLEFPGDPSIVPFEAHRAELVGAGEDPFSSTPRATASSRARRKQRVR